MAEYGKHDNLTEVEPQVIFSAPLGRLCPRRIATFVAFLLCLLLAPESGGSEDPPRAPQPKSGLEFVRFTRHERLRASLDTSIRTYRHPETRCAVTLVSAVHIGDRAYYEALQEVLDAHDLVLFERVGTEDESEAERSAAFTQLALLQIEFSKLLEFDQQMDRIDYARLNLLHADMSLREFTEALDDAGEVTLFDEWALRIVAPIARIGVALLRGIGEADPHYATRLRWQMAVMLSDLSNVLIQLGIDDLDNPDDVILGVRNRHAWEVLEEVLPERYQRVAIFYGAAHMPDFQRRLYEAGWRFETATWVEAWRIPGSDADGEDGDAGTPPQRKRREADLRRKKRRAS